MSRKSKSQTLVASPALPPIAVDIPGAAALLSVSPWQVRALILEKKLHPIRLGRKFVFRTADIQKFLDVMASEAA